MIILNKHPAISDLFGSGKLPGIALLFAILCTAAYNLHSAESDVTVNSDIDQLKLVQGGKPTALVVIADHPSPVATLAAQEFVEHVHKATGATLEVVPEGAVPDTSRVRIYIGKTNAAFQAGVDVDRLANNEFILKTQGQKLYIAGKENSEPYGRFRMHNGTLYGVYEVLERALDVRWYFPGELGTHVPQRSDLALPAFDQQEAVAMKSSYFRIEHLAKAQRDYKPEMERIGFSREILDAYTKDVEIFLRRHRTGFSEPRSLITVDHTFSGWWERLGAKHPDWFMMNREGKRVGPTMCVSNPQLAEYIANTVWNGKDNAIHIGEVDQREYCHCKACMEWDAPLPEGWPTEGTNRVISNRYARFAALVRDLARKRNPSADFRVNFFIYFNYFHSPTTSINLSGTLANFCPWFSGFSPWYPMSDAQHKKIMDTWMEWHALGVELVYRPNHLLAGYLMPHQGTRQSGEMFRHAANNGSRGCDFDSLWAQWSVRGPEYYVLLRLVSDPTRQVEDLRKEYFEGFGPAASSVGRYFDYWEEYSATPQGRRAGRWDEPWIAGMVFPESVFAPAFKLLEDAAMAVKNADTIYQQRVEYLRIGVEHARLAARFTDTLGQQGRTPLDSPEKFEVSRKAFNALMNFRKQHQRLYITDLVAAAMVEMQGFNLEPYFSKNVVFKKSANSDAPDGAKDLWGGWFFRKDQNNVGLDQKWFVASQTASVKGIRNFDDGSGQAFEIDRKIWQTVSVPASLSDTEVGTYDGYGWYATTFRPPEEWNKGSIKLYFGGVDEQAWVYVNGHYVGEHTEESEGEPITKLWNKPFSISVPANVLSREGQNLLMVRFHSVAGESGVTMPVLASPAE